MIGLAVAIAIGATWRVRSRAPEPLPAPAGPWSHLAPLAAYEAGIELMKNGQHLESLPYFRHSYARTRGQIWEVPYAMFAALRNASFAGRERYHKLEPATRSSVERARMVHEALFYLTQAEHAATESRDIATIRKDRADLMLLWGFPWEAFANYRDAQAADSTWDSPGLVADTLVALLGHPGPDG